jgi:hypothetical protein
MGVKLLLLKEIVLNIEKHSKYQKINLRLLFIKIKQIDS